MRYLACLVSVVACFVVGATNVNADDAAKIEAVRTAFTALGGAFERKDADTIRRTMTADHIAATPYYGQPQSVAEQIRSLSDFKKFTEKPVSKIAVSLLAPDVALITFLADDEGIFEGRPFKWRVFVSAVMVKRGGRWLEKLYQVTRQKP